MISDDCIPESPWTPLPSGVQRYRDCPECDGSGEVYAHPSERYSAGKCPLCKGAGRVERSLDRRAS